MVRESSWVKAKIGDRYCRAQKELRNSQRTHDAAKVYRSFMEFRESLPTQGRTETPPNISNSDLFLTHCQPDHFSSKYLDSDSYKIAGIPGAAAEKRSN